MFGYVATYFRQIRRVTTAWDLFVLILPVLSMSSLLMEQALLLWRKEHMQFFPLAYFACVWFLYNEGRAPYVVGKTRKFFALCFAWSGLLATYFALVMQSSWFANLSLIFLIFAWSVGKLGNLSLLRICGICGLLVVALPPPFDMDIYMVQSLQSISTLISARILDLANLLHVTAGNVIEIPSKSLFVEEACSGIDSQYALMAIAGVLLLASGSGFFVSLLTILTVPIWAILGNILRITFIIFAIEYLGVDLSVGVPHTILGLVTFALAAWAHWSSVQFLNFVGLSLSRIESTQNGATRLEPSVCDGHSSIRLRIYFLVLPGILLIGSILGFWGSGPLSWSRRTTFNPSDVERLVETFPVERDLPKNENGMQRVSFSIYNRDKDAIFGRHSRVWTYVAPSVTQTVSIDLPFVGWHSLWICYELTGWTNIKNTLITQDGEASQLDWPFFECVLQNQSGEHAILLFSLFDQDGNPVIYDPGNFGNAFYDRFGRTLLKDLFRSPMGKKSPSEVVTFQFQILSKSVEPFTDNQIEAFRDTFVRLRDSVREKSMPSIRAFFEAQQH